MKYLKLLKIIMLTRRKRTKASGGQRIQCNTGNCFKRYKGIAACQKDG